MKIKDLTIKGVGGIKNLQLNFNDGFNVICGANGVGKTTILNTIVDSFTNTYGLVKKNSTFQEGEYTLHYEDCYGNMTAKTLPVKEFDPNKHDSGRLASDNSIYVMIFGINRIINYRPLEAIPKDSERSRYEAGNQLNGGIEVADLKGWFVNRYVFYDKKDSVVVEQKANFDIAKKAFGLLDSSTEFLTVDSGSLDIKLRTPRGDIYFEYLSAGYKTCIYLVLGILKEIEFRFKEPYIKASEFDGVIMIDEIDLHLHPTWQAQLIDTLKILFPAAQFIVTTHSPSILQTLNPEEIIPLGMDEEGNTYIKELNLGEYGLQGWTLEEILKDVMEMPSTNSKIFEEVKRKFDDAMDAVDIPKINENYDILQKMLHLDNPLRKLLEIQMIGLEEEE